MFPYSKSNSWYNNRNHVKTWHSSTVYSLNGHQEKWDARHVNERIVVKITDAKGDQRTTEFNRDLGQNGVESYERMPELSLSKTRIALSSNPRRSHAFPRSPTSQTLYRQPANDPSQWPTSRQTTIYQVEEAKSGKEKPQKDDAENLSKKQVICEDLRLWEEENRELWLDSPAQTGPNISHYHSNFRYDADGKSRGNYGYLAIEKAHNDDDEGGRSIKNSHLLKQFILTSKSLAEEMRCLKSYMCEDERDESNILMIQIEPDEKEEILTITSPSADEFTDSGIENNRFTSTPHSPSTSTDFSPRSDKPTPISSRFIRTASPLVEDVPPPLPSVPPPPLPSGHDDELNKDETDEDYVVETLRPYVEMENMVETKKEFAYSKESSYPYKMPNRTHSEESIKLDQVVVGLTLSKERYDEDLKTALAEREAFFKTTSTTYPAKFDSLSRSSLSLSEQIERPSDLSIKETTASFNCKKTYEENAKVDAVVAQPAYDTAEKRVIKERKLWKREEMGEIPLDVVSPLSPLPIQETKRAAAIDGSAAVTRDKSTKTVSVGVEVCREQNAKVSAFKFPNKLSRESVVLTVKPSGKMSPVTHFRTVDIPFDDTPSMEPIVTSHKAQSLEGGNLPDPNGMMVVKMQLNSGSESPGFDRFDNHGFGFSLRGGKEHNAPLAVDTVLVNTPADRCGLQVGDIVLNINGESTIDKYYQTAKRMLNEAIRLGEIEMQIQRSSGPSTFLHKDINKSDEVPLMKSPSFDDRRIVFERKPSETNSYYEFKQKRQTRRFEGPSEPAHKASGSISSVSPQSSKSSDYGHDDTSDHLTIDSRGTPDSLHHIPRRTPKKMLRCDSPDYRVVSLDDKPDPGRLDDFVPEVERETKMIEEENKVSRVPSRRLERNEEPKLIRNYDLNLVKRSNESLHSIRSRTSSVQKESVDAAVGDKENDEDDEKSDIDRPVVDTREWRQFIREQRLPNPGHTSSLNHINADSKFEIIHKPTTFGSTNVSSTLRPIIKTVERNVIARRDEREIPVKLETASYSPQKPSRKDDSTSAQQNGDEPIMSVSGKHKCAHCHQELGRGAAMIIESLNLFYHLSCFRCYVCNIPLGNGTKGADVRVRDTKLHCQKCYSNDEINMKFSQI